MNTTIGIIIGLIMIIIMILVLAVRELMGDVRQLREELEEVKLGQWHLRLILAGKGYGVLTRKVTGDDTTISCSYYADRSSQEFCTKFYSKDNKDESNI